MRLADAFPEKITFGATGELPSFECHEGPWYGPKSRAARCLQGRTAVLEPVPALLAMREVMGERFQHVQHVRFIDYVHEEHHNRPVRGIIRPIKGRPGFRYTIAVIWTASDEGTRALLFEEGPYLTELTGWYPLPQGERMESRRLLKQARRELRRANRPRSLFDGPFMEFESAVDPNGGCAIRLRGKSASLLLDTGFGGQLRVEPSDRAALLTHFHRDHSGGATTGATGGMPVLLSEQTARMLLGRGWVKHREVSRGRFQTVRPGWKYRLGGGVRLIPFAVPHCPGATGYSIDDGVNHIVYPGDIVLQTSRHDFLFDLKRIIKSKISRELSTTVFLDATMVGRDHGASQHRAASEIVEVAAGYTDIVVTSRDAEQLLYAYLDVYNRVTGSDRTRHTCAFVVTSRLRKTFQIVHAHFMSNRTEGLDPFIDSQYRASRSAWAETRWLFWLGRYHELPRQSALLVCQRGGAGQSEASRACCDRIRRTNGEPLRVPLGRRD